jgi:YidC/Oxa1 family membrane protein insertase
MSLHNKQPSPFSPRTFAAMGLCLLFIIFWNYIGHQLGIVQIVEVPAEEVVVEETTESGEAPAELADVTDQAQPEASEVEAAPAEPVEVIERTRVVLENDEMRVVVDNKGGVISSHLLRNFFQTARNEEPVRLVNSSRYFPGQLIFDDGSSDSHRMYRVESSSSAEVVLVSPGEPKIEKKMRLGDTYAIYFEIAIDDTVAYQLVVGEGLQSVAPDESIDISFWDFGAIPPKHMKVAYDVDGDEDELEPNSLEQKELAPLLETPGLLQWAGIKDTYFANVFLNDELSLGQANAKPMLIRGHQDGGLKPVVTFLSEGNTSGLFYMGPVKSELLNDVDARLETLVNYGWAGLLSKYLLVGLRWTYSIVGNWGMAIVLLTLFVRILMIPLTLPSIKSSYKMRQLQPEMEKLKTKYAGDSLEQKQKLQQEMFGLYKREGVNPFGSCLLALAQMPIFFAYFSMLRTAIELRQADFFFYINDLSVKDPYYILPVVMAATMYVSTQAMSMPSADPMQQRMMKIMPIMFSIFLLGMPSGLIVYMITSNLFTMCQSLLFKWRYENK